MTPHTPLATPKDLLSAPSAALTVAHRSNPDPADPWYHLIPLGTFHVAVQTPDGKSKLVQEIVDQQALQNILASYHVAKTNPAWPGYLLGIEHDSQLPNGSTRAAGWFTELEIRPTGLHGKLEKTEFGKTLIGGDYKFFSTVNHLESRGSAFAPVDIVDVGLTNKPAYKTLVPASHRAAGDPTHEEDSAMLDRIRTLLAAHKVAIAPDAGEDIVAAAVETTLAAVAAQTDRAVKAEHRVKELEDANLDRDAAAFVAAHKDKFGDETKLKTLFMAGPKAAADFVALLKPPMPAQTRVLHRDDGATPPAIGSGETAEGQRARDQRDAVAKVQAAHKDMSAAIAWAMAQNDNPELFKPIATSK